LFFSHKAFNGHLPHFVASTCPKFWDNLPLGDDKHLPPTVWEPAFG